MRLTSFWDSPEWRDYEAATGAAIGARARLLAAADWRTRVIDLRPDERALWAGVRGSYHALINRFGKDEAFAIVAADRGAFLAWCVGLHVREAGGMTRSWRSWEVQADWIDQGCGLALVGLRVGEPVGFAYFVRHYRWAYYFSAATIQDHVAHALQWAAIRRLKADGVERYEIGWQGQATDEKGKSIEFFKTGFGGADIPVRATVAEEETDGDGGLREDAARPRAAGDAAREPDGV